MKEKLQMLAIEKERHLAVLKVSLVAKIYKVKELELLRKHSYYCKSYYEFTMESTTSTNLKRKNLKKRL